MKDEICSDFLSSKCMKDRSCTSYHCVKPYQWQYQIATTKDWTHFDATCNDILEQHYCDVQSDAFQHKLSYIKQ